MGAEFDHLFNSTLAQRQASRMLGWCRRYRAGELDSWGMHLNLRGVATSLEHDVPQAIRETISGAEAAFEGMAFGAPGDAEAILDRLETLLEAYLAQLEREEWP